jgi:hypothetical protein
MNTWEQLHPVTAPDLCESTAIYVSMLSKDHFPGRG